MVRHWNGGNGEEVINRLDATTDQLFLSLEIINI